MRKYVFITPHIEGMGGAQMYLYSKYKTLAEQGWDVTLLHASRKPSILPILKDLHNAIPELLFQTNCYTKRRVNKVINHIIQTYFTKEYEEIIIESTCIPQSTWAELLAQRVGGKHLAFLLQEINVLHRNHVDFIKFKQDRNELAGIKKDTITRMFQSYIPFNASEANFLTAYGCANTVYDVEHPIVEQVKALNVDYIIGSVGRLDKPFVMPSLDKIYYFIAQHPKNTFALVLLGGSSDFNIISNIMNKFKQLSNCKLLISGFLFPLPKAVFPLIDVFIGTAGSANVAMREGCISISIDAVDCLPIGILGQTTNNSLSRSAGELPLDLCVLLDEVLFKKKYNRTEATPIPCPDYTSHFEFIYSSKQEKAYYDVFKIKNRTLHSKLMKAFISIFGSYKYINLRRFKVKIIHKNNVGSV